MQPENYFGKEGAFGNLFPSHVKCFAITGRFSYQQCPDKNSRHLPAARQIKGRGSPPPGGAAPQEPREQRTAPGTGAGSREALGAPALPAPAGTWSRGGRDRLPQEHTGKRRARPWSRERVPPLRSGVGWLSSPREGGSAPRGEGTLLPALPAPTPLREGPAEGGPRSPRPLPSPRPPHGAAPALPYLRRGGLSYPRPSLPCLSLPCPPAPSPHGRSRSPGPAPELPAPATSPGVFCACARGPLSALPRPRSALPSQAAPAGTGPPPPGQGHSRRENAIPAGKMPLRSGQGHSDRENAIPAGRVRPPRLPQAADPQISEGKLLLFSLEKNAPGRPYSAYRCLKAEPNRAFYSTGKK
ncbi:translation initiation factor IF-2-like [Passer montanus]|uniref:translation initiation factor IF-2-like n=1 Tax=Passer montanus TaxID=9160 RepID=UPI0019607F62|nr:translation initiation factor IF-2-like [Passer montanus]